MKKANAAFERLLPTKFSCMGIPIIPANCLVRSANAMNYHMDPTHLEAHVDNPQRVAVEHNGHYSPIKLGCLQSRRPKDRLTETSLTLDDFVVFDHRAILSR